MERNISEIFVKFVSEKKLLNLAIVKCNKTFINVKFNFMCQIQQITNKNSALRYLLVISNYINFKKFRFIFLKNLSLFKTKLCAKPVSRKVESNAFSQSFRKQF